MDLAARLRDFIDDVVIPAEPEGDDALERLKAGGQGARAVGARPSGGDRRRQGVGWLDFVGAQRDHRPLRARPVRRRQRDDAGRDHAAPLRDPRAAGALPAADGRRRHLPERRAHRAGGRGLGPDADPDHRDARRRRVGDRRPQVVHHRRRPRRLHDRLRPHGARRRAAPRAHDDDHRPGRHARPRDRPPHPDHGRHPRRPLRAALHGVPRPGRRTRSATRGARLRDRPGAPRARPHLPRDALARPGPARLRADARPRQRALRPRLAARARRARSAATSPSRRSTSRPRGC